MIEELEIRYAEMWDLSFLSSMDRHIKRELYKKKIIDKESLIVSLNKENIWLLRFNFFWDEIPFLNLIILKEKYRNKWYWKELLYFWELEMRNKWYKSVMTSTQSDEYAQHFYRRNWYKDIWWFVIWEEPKELLFFKNL